MTKQKYSGYITYSNSFGEVRILFIESMDITTIEENYGSIVDNGLEIIAVNFYQMKEV